MARAAVHWYSLRGELPQHHERAPALASVPSLPFVSALPCVPVLAPPPCSERSRRYVRVQVVAGQPAQPQATRRAQATPPAKALLSELDPPTRWALPQVGGSEPGARPGNRRRLQTHPTRRRPRR